MSVVLFFLIFGLVVISHEFGHFIIAKANGIHVVEFAIGMGPNIFSFQKGETKYSLKWLPFGGACMFEGEDGLASKDEQLSDRSFLKASVWARIATVVAGPVFNFILGFLIALVMVSMIAMRDPVATEVVEGSAAMEAGLQNGDRIISLNGEKIRLYDDILLFTATYDGGEVDVVYERNGVRDSATLIPKFDEEYGRYMLGISNADFVEVKGLNIFRYAAYEVRYSVRSTYKSLWMLITGKVSGEEVSGPVGIAVNVVGKTYEATKEYGWQNVLVNMLNITMLLSINLGIINLIPLPALDGGRLVFMLIELIRGKPISPEKEGLVHFIGFVFFMVLMVFICFNDIRNVFFN